MKTIGKIIDIIFKIVEWIIAILFAVMVVLVFIQVTTRFLLNSSTTWTEEIVNYSMMWIAMLAACVLMRVKGHMAIDNVANALKGPAKLIFNIISVGIQVFFLVSMILGFFDFLPTASVQVSPVLQLNMGMVDTIFLIAPILMLIGLFDYWIVKKGQQAGYSEEDELLKQVQEEAAAEAALKEGSEG